MLKYFFLFTLFIYTCFNTSFASEPDSVKKSFFNDLINSSGNISSYVDETDLALSRRLDVHYENTPDKFFISYDIDPEIKEFLVNNNSAYTLNETFISENYSYVELSVIGYEYKRKFYFKDDKVVSPLTCLTNNWHHIESKYFKFIIQDESGFNDYCIARLENFVDSTLNMLKISDDRKALLEKNKILYVLAYNDDDIKELTGYPAKGIFIIPMDAIVTRYNTHFHELAHLLINFRLQTLPLYTLPFLQEGFAVAVGGRGGLNKEVLFNMGKFFCEKAAFDYKSILTEEEFNTESLDISYCISGTYNKFLLGKLSTEEYLSLYRKYSGDQEYVEEINTAGLTFKYDNEFKEYLKLVSNPLTICTENCTHGNINAPEFKFTNSQICFNVYSRLMLRDNVHSPNYTISSIFDLFFPEEKYGEQKYLAIIENADVKVYNLYNNELIGLLSKGFGDKPEGNSFCFRLSENNSELKISK